MILKKYYIYRNFIFIASIDMYIKLVKNIIISKISDNKYIEVS